MLATKVRLRFAKRGNLRLVSHHDLMRCFERTIRRAGLRLARTQGFNPRNKVSFPLALGLGIEGRRELVELDLAEPTEPSEVLSRLQASAPPGLDFLEAEPVGKGCAARVTAALYEMAVPPDQRETLRSALESFLASTSWPFLRRRPDRTVEADLRPFLLDARLDANGILTFRMRITPEGSARSEEFLEALGHRSLLEQGAVLVRSDIELAPPAHGVQALTPTHEPEPRNPQECETA